MRRPGYLAGFDDYGIITGQDVNRMRKAWSDKKRRQKRSPGPGLTQAPGWVRRDRERQREWEESHSEDQPKKKGWFSWLFKGKK
jgi:hypothetical protein